MKEVVKRNGSIEPFNILKIASAIYKTRKDNGQDVTIDDCVPEARKIVEDFKNKKEPVPIEEIQDAIEDYFFKNGETKVFKSFVFYREKKAKERENPWVDNDERQDLILQKYLIKGETKKDFLNRISNGNYKLLKIFRNREAIWGGRILYAIGRPGNITGSNCYVAKAPEDTLKDIYRADYDIARTYSYGGGQGLNLSKLRPKGAAVNNSSNTTPGVMVFAEKYSHTTLNTQQESRRGALMLMLDIDHPDVIDFITAKLDLNKINGANISLAISDDFMKAYEADEDWVMRFESPYEIIEKKVKAKDLMKMISYSAHTMGDPGVIFMDTMNNYHFLSEYPEVHFNATNPCGEQPLMENGSCNLGSINFNAFVRNPFTENAFFDTARFQEVVREMTWGLDDMIEMFRERHALQEQRDHAKNWMEIGLGVMGLADTALSMGIGYGTPKFIQFLDRTMKTMINTAAQASAMRAKTHGTYPKYNYENLAASRFYQETLTDETKELIKKYGMRNSRLLSIAPTGSISNILGVSGGVEPFFMLGYQRTIKSMFEQERTVWVNEKTPQKMLNYLGLEAPSQLPAWAQITSQNIDFENRAEVQATIQKYVDTAISSTFNLPNEANTEDIENIYLTGWKKGFKGATVFRDNCKKIGILTGGGEHFDKNPAPFPSIEIFEKWTNKKTGEVKEFVNHITITDTDYQAEKIELEVCPECGAHLVKREGCTQCSNPECYFEKCAI